MLARFHKQSTKRAVLGRKKTRSEETCVPIVFWAVARLPVEVFRDTGKLATYRDALRRGYSKARAGCRRAAWTFSAACYRVSCAAVLGSAVTVSALFSVLFVVSCQRTCPRHAWGRSAADRRADPPTSEQLYTLSSVRDASKN